MTTLQEFKFNYIYELADLIDNSVKAGIEFWNYNNHFFIHAAIKFSKDTLLHLYIVTTAINYHRRDFRKNGSDFENDDMGKWYSLFASYNIKVARFNLNGEREIIEWFDKHIKKFTELFDFMAEEVFYILFANRQFLLEFNNLTSKTVSDTQFPKHYLTTKGTIKRASIPQWVKTAVYHREKGRCVFCNIDLTGLVNTLTNSNYDHIVPLDLFGTNDPCNIQLTCERCNKSKQNKDGTTSNKYIPWWTR
ncbi:MAG: HNH endonuclease [Filimonas sp.]|nr:HNH endonuclease [Filimonas sp.]